MTCIGFIITPRLDEVQRARRAVGRALTYWGLVQVAYDMDLLATELVTNALVHGAPASVFLKRMQDAVRLEVGDASHTEPAHRTSEADCGTRPGLHIVARVADSWGWHPREGGTTFWCVLRWPLPSTQSPTDAQPPMIPRLAGVRRGRHRLDVSRPLGP